MQSAFYISLKPIFAIRNVVTKLLETYFNTHLMVGVHYRDHDKAHDWEIIPPPMSSEEVEGYQRALKFGEGASVDDFVQIMRSIENQFSYVDSSGNLVSTVRFYIASNNVTIKQIFLEKFPTSVAISGDHNRMSNEGIKLALIDWLMLSESAMIINTYGSSYSQEAARRKMVPLVRIYNHQPIFVDDIRLPSCGCVKFLQVNYLFSNCRRKVLIFLILL